jgi:hypothetical protein
MSLANIVNSIKQEIKNTNGPICIYISVGAAVHQVQIQNGLPFLDDMYYHQYPKFLEEMQIIDNLTNIIILIDTILESPPFITIDTHKGLEFNISENNIYRSKNNRHIVYALKESVTMSAYELHYTDITHELHELNNIAIEERILLVYNDFTGKSHKPIAEYFDNMISLHLDHIIYGLGSRADIGCCIDILSPMCKFAYFLENETNQRSLIKVFNIYDLIYHNKNIEEEVNKYPIESIEIISTTLQPVIDDTYDYFSKSIFPVLRVLYQLYTNKSSIGDFNNYFMNHLFPENIFFAFIKKNESIICSDFIRRLYDLIRLKKYKECFDLLSDAFSYHLDKLIYIKKIDMNRLDLMKIVTSDSNEYNWIVVLKNI